MIFFNILNQWKDHEADLKSGKPAGLCPFAWWRLNVARPSSTQLQKPGKIQLMNEQIVLEVVSDLKA